MADTTVDLRTYHKGDISGPGSYGQSAANPLFFAPSLYDKDYDVLTSFNFTLRVEAAIDVPVKTIRGINKTNEYEYIQEGGLNDYVHMVRKQVSQPFQFQVERYVSQDIFEDFIDPLANGTEFVLPLILYMYRGSLGSNLAPVRFYVFNNARVTGVQIGDLDAEKSGLHTVTTTIAYSQLLTVTLPQGAVNFDKLYQFNKDNVPNKEVVNARTLKDLGLERSEPGKPNPDATPPLTAEGLIREIDQRVRTKGDMETLAKEKKYTFQGRVKGENSPIPTPTENVAQPLTQLSIMEMEALADKYVFDKESTQATDHVKTPEGQLSKKLMEVNAEKYRYNSPASDKVVQPNDQKSKATMRGNAAKYKFNDPVSGNVKVPEDQKSKEDMESEALGYRYGDNPSDRVVIPNGQLSKPILQKKNELFRYGEEPSAHVKQPEGQDTKGGFEGKAKKYPAARSARQVEDFLGKKK